MNGENPMLQAVEQLEERLLEIERTLSGLRLAVECLQLERDKELNAIRSKLRQCAAANTKLCLGVFK